MTQGWTLCVFCHCNISLAVGKFQSRTMENLSETTQIEQNGSSTYQSPLFCLNFETLIGSFFCEAQIGLCLTCQCQCRTYYHKRETDQLSLTLPGLYLLEDTFFFFSLFREKTVPKSIMTKTHERGKTLSVCGIQKKEERKSPLCSTICIYSIIFC